MVASSGLSNAPEFTSRERRRQPKSFRDNNFRRWHDGGMKKTEWQIRAKRAGLDQETLRGLLGLSKSGMSLGIRGMWGSGVPQPIRAAIIAWEMMTPEQRAGWVRLAGDAAPRPGSRAISPAGTGADEDAGPPD